MTRGNVGNLVLAWNEAAPTEPLAPDAGHARTGRDVDADAGVVEGATAGGGIGAMPRHDVLQYIAEMCDALAYMAREQRCDTLARLLDQAAAEAAGDRPSF